MFPQCLAITGSTCLYSKALYDGLDDIRTVLEKGHKNSRKYGLKHQFCLHEGKEKGIKAQFHYTEQGFQIGISLTVDNTFFLPAFLNDFDSSL